MSFFESLLLLVVLEWNFMGLAILSKFSLLATFLARGEEKKKSALLDLFWNVRDGTQEGTRCL